MRWPFALVLSCFEVVVAHAAKNWWLFRESCRNCRRCLLLFFLYSWYVSGWRPCSKTCGKGVQKRQILCRQQVTRDHTNTLPDSKCTAPKPNDAVTRDCNKIDCPAENVPGEWSAVMNKLVYTVSIIFPVKGRFLERTVRLKQSSLIAIIIYTNFLIYPIFGNTNKNSNFYWHNNHGLKSNLHTIRQKETYLTHTTTKTFA